MAKAELNPALREIRGALDGYVFRQTPHGLVLSRRPDMSSVKWSPAQQARRKLMREAAAHYRRVMQDPAAAAAFRRQAARAKIPVSSLVMGEFLKSQRPPAAGPPGPASRRQR
jgi:hypothetical protein